MWRRARAIARLILPGLPYRKSCTRYFVYRTGWFEVAIPSFRLNRPPVLYTKYYTHIYEWVYKKYPHNLFFSSPCRSSPSSYTQFFQLSENSNTKTSENASQPKRKVLISQLFLMQFLFNFFLFTNYNKIQCHLVFELNSAVRFRSSSVFFTALQCERLSVLFLL